MRILDSKNPAMRAVIDETLVVAPGETHLVPTGLAIHVADPGLANRRLNVVGDIDQFRAGPRFHR